MLSVCRDNGNIYNVTYKDGERITYKAAGFEAKINVETQGWIWGSSQVEKSIKLNEDAYPWFGDGKPLNLVAWP